MGTGQSKKINLINSLLWAVAILVSAFTLRDTGLSEDLILLFISLWLASFLTLRGAQRSVKEEWACFRGLFAKAEKVDQKTDYL